MKPPELFKLLIQDKNREIICELRNDPIHYMMLNNLSEDDFLYSVYKAIWTFVINICLDFSFCSNEVDLLW